MHRPFWGYQLRFLLMNLALWFLLSFAPVVARNETEWQKWGCGHCCKGEKWNVPAEEASYLFWTVEISPAKATVYSVPPAKQSQDEITKNWAEWNTEGCGPKDEPCAKVDGAGDCSKL